MKMTQVQPGTRVMTMISLAGGRGRLERPGVYLGVAPYPGRGETDSTRDCPEYSTWGTKGKMNPQIKLDDGIVIWGCECWWWPE